jgi:hypothetical protein
VVVDWHRVTADHPECIGDDRAGGIRPGTRDEIDQLPPADRRIVAVASGLAEHCQKPIVEPHTKSRFLKTHW